MTPRRLHWSTGEQQAEFFVVHNRQGRIIYSKELRRKRARCGRWLRDAQFADQREQVTCDNCRALVERHHP